MEVDALYGPGDQYDDLEPSTKAGSEARATSARNRGMSRGCAPADRQASHGCRPLKPATQGDMTEGSTGRRPERVVRTTTEPGEDRIGTGGDLTERKNGGDRRPKPNLKGLPIARRGTGASSGG